MFIVEYGGMWRLVVAYGYICCSEEAYCRIWSRELTYFCILLAVVAYGYIWDVVLAHVVACGC